MAYGYLHILTNEDGNIPLYSKVFAMSKFSMRRFNLWVGKGGRFELIETEGLFTRCDFF